MTIRLSCVTLTWALWLGASAASAQAVPQVTPDTPTLWTTGTGEVRITPNRAVVYFGFESRDESGALAAAADAGARQRVIDTLSTLGFSADSVALYAYAVGTALETMRRPDQTPVGDRYVARSGLHVAVHDLARLNEVIGAALSAGAREIPQVQFDVADDSAARARAIELAEAEARRDAEVLARAARARLGKRRLLWITPFFDPAQGMQQGLVRGAMIPLIPSDVVVRVSVQARWELAR